VVKHSNEPYLLSVVIPISKMAGRLQNFQKTYSNICKENEIQIVLIHDLQDSETGVELARIMGPRPNPNVIFLEEFIGSPGGARNLGLKHVQGTWINFVDSDDLYCPIRLMNVIREDETADYSAVISNYETVDSVTNVISPQAHNESLTKIAIRPGIWRWTFRAELVREIKFSPLSMGEDQKFLYQFFQEKRKILFSNDCTYQYAINQDFQLTNQKILL
jgi:glycosyltransferase involved in cell wall biosynthesis